MNGINNIKLFDKWNEEIMGKMINILKCRYFVD